MKQPSARWSSLLLSLTSVMACVGAGEWPREPSELASRTEQPGPTACAPAARAFGAIEQRIFAARGCASLPCHGDAAAGGLDLTPSVAYDALVGVTARSSTEKRVEPGSPDTSYLYRKLRAASEPGSVFIAGSPMPVGGPALPSNELAALRAWIAAGAPRNDEASADLTAQVIALLGPCAQDPEAARDPELPLAVPDPSEGLQLRMPSFEIAPDSEWEGCMATYLDLAARVPARFQDAAQRVFRVASTEMRFGSGTHHLTVLPSGLGAESVHHPAFGAWRCRGGARERAACDPLDAQACGPDGVCASLPKAGVACGGFGPPFTFVDPSSFGLGKSGRPHFVVPEIPGVYRDVGLRGIVYWNLHAYNLSRQPRVQSAELNLFYAADARHPEQILSITAPGYAGIPPFTKRDVCGSWTVPRGATLVRLSSHTHRHGERFWLTDPAGAMLYESLDYRHPVYLALDPPRLFDAPDPAARTLRFCATFNNGVRPDGTPDAALVTRRSRIPDYALTRCTPTACAAGRVGTACRGVADHARCDTAPGRGDGLCDACPIVAGETTEHEMFIMHPDFYLAPRPRGPERP